MALLVVPALEREIVFCLWKVAMKLLQLLSQSIINISDINDHAGNKSYNQVCLARSNISVHSSSKYAVRIPVSFSNDVAP